MPSEKSLENLKKGKKFGSNDGLTPKEAQRKSAASRKKNNTMRAAMREVMARLPFEVLSEDQINALRTEGIDTENKTLMDVSVASLVLQAVRGNVAAAKVIMELLGEDNAAEQRKIERERLALERERMERANATAEDETCAKIIISADGGIGVEDGI
jgi:hypothetical protein